MFKQSYSYASFSRGELSPELFGRGNFAEYRGGAMMFRNMHALGGGGATRRAGTVFCGELPAGGRLIGFNCSGTEKFMLAVMPGAIHIYNEDGAKLSELASPYGAAHFAKLRWAQKGSDLYMVHPDVAPRILSFDKSSGKFSFKGWSFKMMPTALFPREKEIWLSPSDTFGMIILNASEPCFTDALDGKFIKVHGVPLLVGPIISSQRAFAMTGFEGQTHLPKLEPDKEWEEPAFDEAHGWPASITFHQNRLVIGGSRSCPNRLWFSKTGDYLNFNLGSGLDDDAIEFDMLSDKMNEISCVFSGRHLQVFTSDSEWMVAGSPLTPASVVLREQTKVGSEASLAIAPKLVEGSTLFISKGGKELREFVYGETEGGYFSSDLAALSSHLLNDPVELEYDQPRRAVCITNGDGTMAVLTMNKAMDIASWSLYETDGEFLSVASSGAKLFALVKRGSKFFLECFRNDVNTDCARKVSLPSASNSIPNLSHLEGRELSVNADGYISQATVSGGGLALDRPAKNIEAGLAFRHLLAPLPVFSGRARPPKAAKLLELVARVEDTALLEITAGGRSKLLTGRRFDERNLFDIPLPLFTGDLRLRALGLVRDFRTPLFKIEGAKPLKVKILNVSATIQTIK